MSNDSSITNEKAGRPSSIWPFFAVALVVLLLFWGINIWLTSWQGGNTEPEEVQRAEQRAKTLAELRTDNAKKLESYAWVDRKKGSVQIPIAEAMKQVVAKINDAKPRAAYPVATPAPPVTAPPVAPATSTTPAPAKTP